MISSKGAPLVMVWYAEPKMFFHLSFEGKRLNPNCVRFIVFLWDDKIVFLQIIITLCFKAPALITAIVDVCFLFPSGTFQLIRSVEGKEVLGSTPCFLGYPSDSNKSSFPKSPQRMSQVNPSTLLLHSNETPTKIGQRKLGKSRMEYT